MRYLCTRFERFFSKYAGAGDEERGEMRGEKKFKFFFKTLAGNKKMFTFAARFSGAGVGRWRRRRVRFWIRIYAAVLDWRNTYESSLTHWHQEEEKN
jgi:hypothetical protein